jgi:hypothetical protein
MDEAHQVRGVVVLLLLLLQCQLCGDYMYGMWLCVAVCHLTGQVAHHGRDTPGALLLLLLLFCI